MAQLLIKSNNPEFMKTAEKAHFSASFQRFYQLRNVKAIFDNVLLQGDMTLNLVEASASGIPEWDPKTREFNIPFNYVSQEKLLELYLRLLSLICDLNKLPVPDQNALFTLLMEAKIHPKQFAEFAASIEFDHNDLAYILASTVASQFETSNEKLDKLITFGLLKLETQGVGPTRSAQLDEMFELLNGIESFREILKEVEQKQQKQIQIQFKKPSEDNSSDVEVENNIHFTINPDMDLDDMLEKLVLYFANADKTVIPYSDYQTSSDYAAALMKASYRNYNKAYNVVKSLYQSDKGLSLLKCFAPEAPEDLLQDFLLKKVATLDEICNESFDDFVRTHPKMVSCFKRSFEQWRQRQQPVPQSVPGEWTRLQQGAGTQNAPESRANTMTPAFDAQVLNDTTAVRSNRSLPQVPPTRTNRSLPPVPQAKPAVKPTSSWLDLKQSLEKYKQYACSDAKNYGQCIYPGKRDEVLNRYKNTPIHRLAFEAQANATMSDPRTFQYSRFAIKKVGQLIDQAKSGCCTTFALSALKDLLEKHPDMKFKMVASPVENGTAHCFLLALDTENQTYIIDPWLASLGWEAIYSPSDYPMQHYLQNLNVYFDSESSAAEHSRKNVPS